MASGSARPARKNITDETSRLTSSQKATAEIRASAEVRGAPVSRSTRTANAAAEETEEDEDNLCAARRALLGLREEDRIGDEVLNKMLREADLKARAAEGAAAALPGAGPPQP